MKKTTSGSRGSVVEAIISGIVAVVGIVLAVSAASDGVSNIFVVVCIFGSILFAADAVRNIKKSLDRKSAEEQAFHEELWRAREQNERANGQNASENPASSASSEAGREAPRFCPGCGAPVESGFKFCENCGRKL